jgi:hypothetical protein
MLRGVDDTAVTVTKEAAGPLLTVSGNGAGDTPHLILENITLRGYSANDSSLVVAGGGSGKRGTLTMKAGSRITGNTNTYNGGGISVGMGGTFYMKEGKIDDNHSKNTSLTASGGGVSNSGTFVMSGGHIENNTAESEYATGGITKGGGVYAIGIFAMSGGSIESNRCLTTTGNSSYGGGVYASNFTMSDDARIANNSAAQGGGVVVGTNTGNSVAFTMNGGTIRGNTARVVGGGVLVTTNATFTKTGGVIYGTDAGGDSNKAAAGIGTVHAIEVMQGLGPNVTTKYYRDTTAWDYVNLSSGSDAGWEQ